MNKILKMLNVERIKKMIADCPPDEIVIICQHWSINQPKYDQPGEDPEAIQWDWDEAEEVIGEILMVNDFDDLICDPHSILEM